MTPVPIITIDVECWYHSDWFDVADLRNRYAIIDDLEPNMQYLLDLFKSQSIKATFFVLASIANKYPDIVQKIHDDGHEVASHGLSHRNLQSITRTQVREEIIRSKHILEQLTGDPILGFRAPSAKIPSIYFGYLLDSGYSYDASMVPSIPIPGWYGNPRVPQKPFTIYSKGTRSILEFPFTVLPILRLPSNGGWFLRNVGGWWVNLITSLSMAIKGYSVLYLHPWELSDHNPSFPEIPSHVFNRTGAYTRRFLEQYLHKYKLHDMDLTLSGMYHHLMQNDL
jgi:polysaccharide deacetylase family protein (PEP-CTERM system associated)